MCPTIIWEEEICIYCILKVWYNYLHLGENKKLNFWEEVDWLRNEWNHSYSFHSPVMRLSNMKMEEKFFKNISILFIFTPLPFPNEMAHKRQHYHSLMDRINTIKSIETKLKLIQFFIEKISSYYWTKIII